MQRGQDAEDPARSPAPAEIAGTVVPRPGDRGGNCAGRRPDGQDEECRWPGLPWPDAARPVRATRVPRRGEKGLVACWILRIPSSVSTSTVR